MAEGFDFEITGIPQMQANLIAVGEHYEKAGRITLHAIALEIMAEARNRTPVKTGSLRDSGKVYEPTTDANGTISVMMSFGNETVLWAIPVHERMYIKHLSGRSKFLESVILEHIHSYLPDLAQGIAL